MRLHLVTLAHTETTAEFEACAYTAKARKFARMVHRHLPDHELVLYAGERNDAPVAEHVPCITRAEQEQLHAGPPQTVTWDPASPLWETFTARAAAELRARLSPDDLVLLATGRPLAPVAAAATATGAQVVEYGIGYEGVIPGTHKVWESYAWMHAVEAVRQHGAMNADGRWFDAVIPNYFDPDDFPAPAPDPKPFLLYMSRWTDRKGPGVAIDAARRAGLPLVVAGHVPAEQQVPGVEYVGHADPSLRADLMRRARAVLVPTAYLEPFGGVAAEALMCGTPAITTDWGAFPEYVENGVDGFRCHTLREFATAIDRAGDLDRDHIRRRAHARHSLAAVAPLYAQHFARLRTLWEDGFYA